MVTDAFAGWTGVGCAVAAVAAVAAGAATHSDENNAPAAATHAALLPQELLIKGK
jgi:hypothetical protein